LIPRPRVSPLFPYTTLFRSWWSWQRAWVGAFACYGLMSAAAWFSSRMMRDNIALYRYRSRALQRLRRSQMHATALEAWAAAAATDRKSTRLNSSHVKISYAV